MPTTVHLGQDEGVSSGDDISSVVDDYWGDGYDVVIPEGEFRFDPDVLRRQSITEDSTLRGETGSARGVILNIPEYWDSAPGIISNGSVHVELKGFTMRGRAIEDCSVDVWDQISLRPNDPGGTFRVEDVDVVPTADAASNPLNFHIHSATEGHITFNRCKMIQSHGYGIYASGPGEGGTVEVHNSYTENCNLAGIRIGSRDAIVRNCVVVVDDSVPPHPEGSGCVGSARGIWIRRNTSNQLIENCDVYYDHSTGYATSPIIDQGNMSGGAASGSGTIRDCRIYTSNPTSYNEAIRIRNGSWDVENVHITGPGNQDILTTGSVSNICRGNGCETPRQTPPDGSEVTDPAPPSDGGGDDGPDPSEYDHTLLVGGDGQVTEYQFTTTGEVVGTPLSGSYDSIEGTNVTGISTNEPDSYAFNGALESFDVAQGQAVVSVDGQEMDSPADAIAFTQDGSTAGSTGLLIPAALLGYGAAKRYQENSDN